MWLAKVKHRLIKKQNSKSKWMIGQNVWILERKKWIWLLLKLAIIYEVQKTLKKNNKLKKSVYLTLSNSLNQAVIKTVL